MIYYCSAGAIKCSCYYGEGQCRANSSRTCISQTVSYNDALMGHLKKVLQNQEEIKDRLNKLERQNQR